MIRNNMREKMNVAAAAERLSGGALETLSLTLEGFNGTSTTLTPDVSYMVFRFNLALKRLIILNNFRTPTRLNLKLCSMLCFPRVLWRFWVLYSSS